MVGHLCGLHNASRCDLRQLPFLQQLGELGEDCLVHHGATETIRWYIEMSKVQNKIKSARHKQHKISHLPKSSKYTQLKPAQGRAFWRSDPAQTGLPSKWICISTRYYAFTYCIHCDPHKDIRYNIMIKRQVQAVQTVQSVQSVNMLLSFVFYIIHTCCSVGHRPMICWWQLQFRI